MTTRDWRNRECGGIWTGKWNGYHFLSFKPSSFLRRDQFTYMPHHCPDAMFLVEFPFLNHLVIKHSLCFWIFYTHDFISSSRTGWASNIIPISKIEYVEWQRSNVTCSRSRWQWVIKFDQCWSQSMLNTYYKSTLNNFFENFQPL